MRQRTSAMRDGQSVTSARARVAEALREARPRMHLRLLAAVSTLALGAMVAMAGAAAASTGPPLNGSQPTISGIAKQGGSLRARKGTWTGTLPLSFAYRWTRCDAAGEACEDIPAATAVLYKATHEDVGHTLRVVLTASNGEGSSSATSRQTAAVAVAPKKLTAPIVTGLTQDGQVLSAQNGTWIGTVPMTFSYQWQTCTKRCTNIVGATEPTYRAVTADIGQRLRFVVTAKNSVGHATAAAKASPLVKAGPPVAITQPAISGTPLPGQTLEVGTGSWAGTAPISYSYQWLSCNLAAECFDIAGAKGSSYPVAPLDVANSLEVVVSATNAQGSSSVTTPATGLVSALLPSNTGLPSIVGSLLDGGLLSAVTGTWEGTGPLSYSYEWLLCNASGGSCSSISEALASTLQLGVGQVGSTLRVVVTATNSAGSVSATSPATSLVSALLPSNSGLPSITGLLQDGGLLSAVTGSWAGTGPLSYSYQWQQCNASGASCSDISEAAASTLKLLSGAVGSTVRVIVTATNAAGSVSATSPASGLVGALLPSNTGLPSITGLLQDGGLLSAVTGSWAGTGPLSYSYQWQQCNASGASCSDISEAAASTLKLVAGAVGSTVRVVVTATNAAGSTSATSPASSLVGALLPSNIGLPSITGLLQDGGLVSAVTGSWAGTGPLSYAYQWQQCNASGASCANISEAAASTLKLLSGAVGSTVRVIVTATNSAGSVSATSPASGLVGALLPSNTALPSITGLLQDGGLLSAVTGSWAGTGPLSYTYQWQQCNASGASCANISEAAASTLKLLSGAVGSTVRVIVTATNSAGSVSATSPASGLVSALLPSNTVVPAISGLLKVGQILSASTGTWTGTAPITYKYQWQNCGLLGTSCSSIANAIASTLKLELAQVGLTLRVLVTATNAGGSVQAPSAVTGLIAGLL
ncbi:MAG: large repetitive protein [Solirubrobacteraceae bacterium]|nr:large repetitive protein [Solirubrobacteraceae bacterium]